MGEGIAHIISPLSAQWCGWTMLLLFLCGILSEWFQPGVLSQATQSITAHTNRTYKDAPTNFFGQVLVNIFRIGTLAMMLCLCFHADLSFSFASFALACGLIIAIMLIKMMGNALILYTFDINRHFGTSYEHYSNIASDAILVLYPAALILLQIDNDIISRWVLGIVAVLFFGTWCYRAARSFVESPGALIYLVIYLITWELVPAAALLYVSAKTISLI